MLSLPQRSVAWALSIEADFIWLASKPPGPPVGVSRARVNLALSLAVPLIA